MAATLPARDGGPAIAMALPEGTRILMLFEHLDGEPLGEAPADMEATGRGLAMLHEAGRDFGSIAHPIEHRIAAMPDLTRVQCHGDCHGSNNFITVEPDGTRSASFFDFDDAGPGRLAYDLCVYLWAILPRTVGGELDANALERPAVREPVRIRPLCRYGAQRCSRSTVPCLTC